MDRNITEKMPPIYSSVIVVMLVQCCGAIVDMSNQCIHVRVGETNI